MWWQEYPTMIIDPNLAFNRILMFVACFIIVRTEHFPHSSSGIFTQSHFPKGSVSFAFRKSYLITWLQTITLTYDVWFLKLKVTLHAKKNIVASCQTDIKSSKLLWVFQGTIRWVLLLPLLPVFLLILCFHLTKQLRNKNNWLEIRNYL